jgi:hypothetical protein
VGWAKRYIATSVNVQVGGALPMGWEKRRILGIAEGILNPLQRERSLIFWNARTLKEGEEIMAGPQTLKMPFGGTVVFVDLSPRTNWAHPCLYILISYGSPQTKVVESSFPPLMDKPGDKWILMLRFGKNPTDEHDFNPFD